MTSLPGGALKGAALETHSLSTGILSLEIQRADQPDLYRIAERQNPKRAFLFVSTVLGRHIPVQPSKHRSALQFLAAKVAPLLLEGPALVMGYAETAVGLGAGVHDCLRKMHPGKAIGYLHTTRHPVPGQTTWFTITEGHSHATDHFIMKPSRPLCEAGAASTLVLVDDETTTGATFEQLACGLAEHGAHFGRIILVTLNDWSAGRAVDRLTASLGHSDIRSISLLEGQWGWNQCETACLPSLPGLKTPECPSWVPDIEASHQSPRMGIASEEETPDVFPVLETYLKSDQPRGKRILVIGTGEHVWLPFLHAEALSEAGYDASFIATTRSPILPGPVIEKKITFPDHFGIGLDMYLHNVDPDAWDDILLFTETGISGIPEVLRTALGKGSIVDCNGDVHPMICEKDI